MARSVFDQLTASLSSDERLHILEQIVKKIDYEPVSLAANNRVEAPSLEHQRSNLSFFEKIRLFLQSFLGRDHPDEVLKHYLLGKTKKEITRRYSSYLDLKTSRFMPDFCTALNSLAQALIIFKEPLKHALVENRSEFYAILGGEESPHLQHQLFEATSPERILALTPLYDNSTLRVNIENHCNEILREIEVESRATIYNYTSSLAHLERLVNFNYDKCFAYYSKDGSCAASYLSKPLLKLNSILASFTEPPAIKLIEMLFLFNYQTLSLSDHDSINRLSTDLNLSISAIKTVKSFNEFPLTDALRLLGNNYFYQPTILSGGEEWFNLYKKFWKQRADRSYKSFILMRKRDELEANILLNIKRDTLPIIKLYSKKEWPRGYTPFYEKSFGLVDLFVNHCYPKLTKNFIALIKEEGIFYRKDNRKNLINALEGLINIQHSISSFTESLHPQGDIFMRLHPEKEALVNDVNKNYHLALTISNRLVLSMIQSTIESLRILSLIFEALSKGFTFDGHYSSISNITELEQRHTGLKNRIDQGYVFVKNYWTQLIDMKDMEDRILRIEESALSYEVLR